MTDLWPAPLARRPLAAVVALPGSKSVTNRALVLAALAEGGWIGTDARNDLEAAYHFLRTIEHRLQMVADEQTHTLPDDSEAVERFGQEGGGRLRGEEHGQHQGTAQCQHHQIDLTAELAPRARTWPAVRTAPTIPSFWNVTAEFIPTPRKIFRCDAVRPVAVLKSDIKTISCSAPS